jgi:hypothetical protein
LAGLAPLDGAKERYESFLGLTQARGREPVCLIPVLVGQPPGIPQYSLDQVALAAGLEAYLEPSLCAEASRLGQLHIELVLL